MRINHKLAFPFISCVMIACLVSVLSACDHKKSSQTTKKHSSRPLPVVEMALADYQMLTRRIQLTGTLEPKKSVHLYNQTPGLIIQLPFYEGDKVKQGEILAQLDDTIIKAEFNKASANFRQSKLDYGRPVSYTHLTLPTMRLRCRSRWWPCQ